MSNLWFNIRIGTYFWQLGPDGWSWKRNDHWVRMYRDYPLNINNHIGIYCLFGKHL